MVSGNFYQGNDGKCGECSVCLGMPPLGLNPWKGLQNVVQHYVQWRESHFESTGAYTPIYVFTIDDPAQMAWLIRGGVNGIITNKPSLLSEVYQNIVG